jgi:hypothetical protein
MADARLRDSWLGEMRFDALSDVSWRVFTSALMWSVKNGTDGYIPPRYLKHLHPDGEQSSANEELARANLWLPTKDGYQLTGWHEGLGQSTAAELTAYREGAKLRARKSRAAAVAFREGNTASPQPIGTARDVRPHVGKGKGKGNGSGDGEDNSTQSYESADDCGDTELSEVQWKVRVPGTEDVCAGELPRDEFVT